MRRWLRVTLPTDWTVSAFILIYVLLELWHSQFGGPAGMGKATDFLVEFGAISYGALRVAGFHPVFNPDYHKWLAATPWTWGHPLPAGPVRLVLQDLVIVGFLMAVALMNHPTVGPLHLAIKFLTTYELALAVGFILLGMAWFAYATAFGLGLIVLTWHNPPVALAVTGVLYGISLVGINVSLRDFAKWDLSWMDEQQFLSFNQQKNLDRMRSKVLGWPYDCIGPQAKWDSFRYRDGFLLSVLIGWYALALALRFDGLKRPDFWHVFLGFIAFPCALIRLLAYYWGYASPLSFWGRVFRLRWIIPGYDYAALAPLSVILLASGGEYCLTQFPDRALLIGPLTITLMLLADFNMGPSIKRWRLTGNHRLSQTMLMASKQAELQQL